MQTTIESRSSSLDTIEKRFAERTAAKLKHDLANPPTTAKLVLLPEKGKRFQIDGIWYVVTYINIGKMRFSSEPISDDSTQKEAEETQKEKPAKLTGQP